MRLQSKLDALGKLFEESEFESLVRRARVLRSRINGTSPAIYPIGSESSQEPLVATMFGDYEVVRRIGQGGMGRVYLARQVGADRHVALKIIRPDVVSANCKEANSFVSRFKLEALAMASLNHDNVVTVYEVGEIDSRLFYSMMLIDGESLERKLKNGPLDPEVASRMIRSCAAAVVAAHRAGILHRDIKPANILIDRNDRPYIADFGLAKRHDSPVDLTLTGTFVGTASFMSPEQAQDSSRITESTDIYSLGAVLYACLTGRPPFQASTVLETIRQVISDEVVTPRRINPAVPRDLDTICLKCLEKNPGMRYSSVQSLVDDLHNFLHCRPIVAKRVSTFRKARLWCARNRTLSSLVLAMAVSSFLLFASLRYNTIRLADAATEFKVDQIKTAGIAVLDSRIHSLRADDNFDPDVMLERFRATINPDMRFRYALVISDQDADCKSFAIQYALSKGVDEVRVVRSQIVVADLDATSLWRVATSGNEFPERRLRACCLLAKDHHQDYRWQELSKELVPIILELDAINASSWIRMLDPVLPNFEDLLLKAYASNRPPLVAALALAQLNESRPAELLHLLAGSEEDHFPVFIDFVSESDTSVRNTISELIAEHRDFHTQSQLLRFVNLVVGAVKLNLMDVCSAFGLSEEPVYKHVLADRIGRFGGCPISC